MSQFLKAVQPQLNEVVYDITGLTLSDRFNPYKKLFEDSIIHRGRSSVEKCHVDKHLHGLKDKYYIHAQDKKGDLLEYLVKHFYNRPLLGHPPESELHHACLQLVISLACKPLEVKLDDFSNLVHEQIEEANFDWPTYLLGKNYKRQPPIPIDDADNDSDGEDQNDSTFIANDSTDHFDQETKTADDVEQQNYLNLERDILTSYWHRNLSDDVSPSLREFALFWDQAMIKTTHLAYRVNSQTLTEYILIRESLWLLMNITQLHVYTIGDDLRIHVADFVRLCDVTPVTTQECLEKVTNLANQLRLAYEFLDENHRSCRTLSSFSQALQEQMTMIQYDLANIERRCLQQNCTYTILSLNQELESLGIVAKGKCLERIFDQLLVFLHEPNCDISLELIHTLFKNLLIAEMLSNPQFFNFFLPLFIASCRIYLEIIQFWLTNGILNDPFEEFFIKRKADVAVDSIDFWSLSYTEQVQNASLIPKWLAAIVPSLVKAGKCAEILKFNKILSPHHGELSFVKAFSQHLLENLHLTKGSWNPLQSLRPSSTDGHDQPRSKPVVSLTLSFDDIDHEKNAFLALAFNRMQTPSSSLLEINRDEISPLSAMLLSTDIESILQKFSEEVLLVRCNRLIQQLTSDILDRLKYLTHMQSIRDFFLFENGSLMHQFAVRLYAKLSQTIHERLDAFTVLVSFDSALNMFGLEKDRYPLSVIYQSSNESNSTQHKYIIQDVQLKYELPKELFIIVPQEQMDVYQKCFTFVLQVKQAKHVLDQLVFIEFRVKTRLRNHRLYRHQSYHLHHEMFLLRARLLHAVNAVNNFVLTTFHSAGEEFIGKHANPAIDIESMIEFHEKFLVALAIGGLLQPKQQAIREQLMKLFEIVTIFARRWQLGFDSIQMEHIVKLKNEFNQSKQFISTVLKPFLPRMIDSPLRALACALQDDFYSNT